MMMDVNLRPRISRGSKAAPTQRGWLLSIPAGPSGRYRLAQLDDHRGLPRHAYPCRPPFTISLEARVSSPMVPGTWGFGIWNDPYGFSFSPGNGLVRLPALPNAAWFFSSSPASYLSFRDDRPANGFLAQVFASPRFDPLVVRAAIEFPFSAAGSRRLLSRVIREDARRLDGNTQPRNRTAVRHDVTQWNAYTLDWTALRLRFSVNEALVLDTPLSPRPPLGVVIWIDNQRAGFDPRGRVTFGLEANPEPAWLEIRDLRMG